jgi:hypothetical protein
MRPLRWKTRYRTGDSGIDGQNRAFVDCFNSLINAAGTREHCQEMEDLIGGFGAEAEKKLQDHSAGGNLVAEFGRRLLASLPFSSYDGPSCRQCGLCDLAQHKIAEHLKAPAECLFKSKRS